MRILIAGGGTGGHIYPGIAIGEELLRDGRSDVLFVGTGKGLEAKIVPEEGYKLVTIPAGGIVKKKVITRAISGIKILMGTLKAGIIIKKYNPHVVIGTGGYVSLPVLLAASLLRYPTLILEQNLFPGLANRIMARFVDKVVVAFKDTERYLPGEVVTLGNPVRRKILEIRHRETGRFVVLIFGGSQGASAINRSMVEALSFIDIKDMTFIHQTGPRDYQWVREAYEKYKMDARVEPFLFHIEEAYEIADLVICRSGATTVAELMACEIPAILIPYPHAIHDHQRKNAEYLARQGCAEMILEKNLSGKLLAERITYFYHNRGALKEMSGCYKGLYNRNVTRDIVEICKQLGRDR